MRIPRFWSVWLTALATAGLLLTVPAAVAGASSLATKPVRGGVFTMDFAGDFPTLDPITWQDVQSAIPMEAIYDTLVTYNLNNTNIVCDLCSSYSVSKDGLTYTFHLRHGVRFSNGDPLTAADVKWSLDRVTSFNPGPSGAAPYGSSYSDIVGYSDWFTKSPTVNGLSGISTPDNYTVVIHLQQPQAYFLNELALEAGAILDPAVVEKYGPTHYEYHAVGTGPYMLLYWHPNQQMVLVPNPYYNGPDKPMLSRVVFNVNVPTSTQFLLFRQGKVDMIYMVDSATYLSVVSDPSLMKLYHKAPTNAIWYLAFNTTKPPFDKQLVREAVNLAINRKALLRLVNGRWSIMTQVLPPAMPGYDKTLKGYPYNPKEAKKLLAEAGYPHGFTITYAYTSGRPFVQDVAQAIQQQLSQIGITVELHNIGQTSSYWSYEGDPKNPWNIAWSDWWQDYPDPQDFLFNLLDSQNIAGGLDAGAYHDPAFDKLVEQADALPASEDAQRWKLYDEAQKIWYKDAPWVPLFYPTIDALIQPWVGPDDLNVFLHPVQAPLIRYMFVTKH